MQLSSFVSVLAALLGLAPLVCQAQGMGGPDAYGYAWIDSTAVGGPTFTGHDISGTGMQIVVGDDAASGPVTLGQAFILYGQSVAQLKMAANGYITTSLTDTGSDLTNDCPIPAMPSTGGGARIYVLQDDLDLEAGIGAGFYQYFAACPRVADRGPNTGCSIFMWRDVAHFPGGVTAPIWDMWAYLYDNRDLVFEYGAGNPETGSGSTTGLQNEPFTIGLNVACNLVGSIPDGHAILIQAPPAPSCTLTEPAILPAGGDVPLALDAMSTTVTQVDATFEHSTDAGVTWQTSTASATSPLANPAVGVAIGPSSFIWDSLADGVGVVMSMPGVLCRATIDDGLLTAQCSTLPFTVDNSSLCIATCGDCNLSMAPPDILDALIAAQIAAFLIMPTPLQLGCCDVNASGAVSIIDALLTAQSAAGLAVVLTCP